MRLTLLGTGGPLPDPLRAGPATVIEIGGQPLLFDAGRGVATQLVRAGFELATIDKIFLTHHHFDHIGDLADIVISSWLLGRLGPVDIYGPSGTKALTDRLFGDVYGLDIEFRDRGEPFFGGWKAVVGHDLGAGTRVGSDEWRVLNERVRHMPGTTIPGFSNRWNCFGYRVEAEGKVIAISGDTVPCRALERLAANADVLVMCSYFTDSELTNEHRRRLATRTLATASAAGQVAQRCSVGSLILTHIRAKPVALLDEMGRAARSSFGGPVVVGEDLFSCQV